MGIRTFELPDGPALPHGWAVGIVVHPTRAVDGSVRSIAARAAEQGRACLGREIDAERLGPG